MHAIKLSGKFNVEFPLEIDKDYEIKLTGSVDAITKHSDGGELEYVYALKPIYGEVTADNGKTTKVIKKGSQSQKLRYEILQRGLEYEQTMSKIIDQLDNLLEKLN